MSTELSSTREPRSRFSDKYLPPDREALYELMANPDSLFTHSLFKLMAKPGELTPVRHNEDSGELYFLTADSVAKNPIGSVKIPRPSDIDDSTQRTQEDIKEDGLRIMTLNTAGLGYGTGYPRSIAKSSPRILMPTDWPLWEFKDK